MQTAARGGGMCNHPPPCQASKQMSDVGNMTRPLAGGAAAEVGKTCTVPLGRLTIPFQVGFLSEFLLLLNHVQHWF